MAEDHVDAYFQALRRGNMPEVARHLADGIILESPVFTEPVVGKETMLKVMAGLRKTIDDIRIRSNLHLRRGDDHAVFFIISCDGIECDGNEHLHTGPDGLIDHINVAWRPLEKMVEIQRKLAAHLGGTAKYLVEVPPSDQVPVA